MAKVVQKMIYAMSEKQTILSQDKQPVLLDMHFSSGTTKINVQAT
jgi:hypothetical protein